MRLDVFERLLLRNMIPHIQGWDDNLIKEAQEFLVNLFTQEEKTDLAFEQENGRVKWRVKRDDGTDIPQERDIPISEGLRVKISQSLEQFVSLYEKFNQENC